MKEQDSICGSSISPPMLRFFPALSPGSHQWPWVLTHLYRPSYLFTRRRLIPDFSFTRALQCWDCSNNLAGASRGSRPLDAKPRTAYHQHRCRIWSAYCDSEPWHVALVRAAMLEPIPDRLDRSSRRCDVLRPDHRLPTKQQRGHTAPTSICPFPSILRLKSSLAISTQVRVPCIR